MTDKLKKESSHNLASDRAIAAAEDVDSDSEALKKGGERQEAFVVFSNEKDLRHHEAIRIKAGLYTGIALRVKLITPGAMENLLYAIDLDSGVAELRGKEKEAKAKAIEEAKKGPPKTGASGPDKPDSSRKKP